MFICMKILFLSATEYALEHFAGPYILALRNAGHKIHVLTGGDIGSYNCPPDVIQKSIMLNRKPNPLRDLQQIAMLVRYMRKHKFDTIYSISPKGGLVAQVAARLSLVKNRIHFVTGQTWNCLLYTSPSPRRPY